MVTRSMVFHWVVWAALLALMVYPFFHAHADNEAMHHQPALCVDKAISKAAIEAKHGKWITVTTDQWEWLRGVYVLNPATPQGLPPGDRAVLAKIEGNSGAMIFFIDGDLACVPMAVPDAIIDLMNQIDASNVFHTGPGI